MTIFISENEECHKCDKMNIIHLHIQNIFLNVHHKIFFNFNFNFYKYKIESSHICHSTSW